MSGQRSSALSCVHCSQAGEKQLGVFSKADLRWEWSTAAWTALGLWRLTTAPVPLKFTAQQGWLRMPLCIFAYHMSHIRVQEAVSLGGKACLFAKGIPHSQQA